MKVTRRCTKTRLTELRGALAALARTAMKEYDDYHYAVKPLGTHELGKLSGARDASLAALRAFDEVFNPEDGVARATPRGDIGWAREQRARARKEKR
jgi:hypothetical protein